MLHKTSLSRVLFRRCPNTAGLAVFGVFLVSLIATSVWSSFPVQAATSSNLNFQARLQTNTGAIVPDGYYNIEFKIYDAATSSGSSQGSCAGDADCLWTETRYDSNGATAGNDNRVRVRNGYLTVNLGSVTAFPGSIPWDQELWLTMRVGGSTQTVTPTYDPEMSPRLQLTGVPYAFKAGDSATLGGIAAGGFIQNTTTPQTADFNITGNGTIGGNLTVNGNANLIKPSSDSTTAFQIQPAGSTAPVFNVDTTNGRVGIGTDDPDNNLHIYNTGNASARLQSTNTNGFIDLYLQSDTREFILGTGGSGTSDAGLLYVYDSTAGQYRIAIDSNGDVGIGNNSNPQYPLDVTGDINSSTGYRVAGVAGASTTCTGGQLLQNAAVSGGIITGGSCVAAAAGGVTTVGTLDSQTKSADGAVISGTNIYMQTADATNPGLVSTGAQTFAGSKTFNGNLTLFKPASDSITAFQIQPAGSATPVFNVDTTNGRVGIGTAAPESELEVVGQLRASGVDGSLKLMGQDDGGDSAVLYSATGEFTFYTGLNVRAVLTASGRLGVGLNSNPQYPLDVTGDINSSTGYRVAGVAGASTTCTGGQLLQNAAVSGGIITGGSCVAAADGGVTTVGTFSGTSIANGASISANTITFGAADGTNPGMISTGAQTIAGAKTFSDVLSADVNVAADFAMRYINNSATGYGLYGYVNNDNNTNELLRLDNSAGTALTIKSNGNVSTVGSIVGVGVNAGAGLLQGTGGLTVTGDVNINASGSGDTNIGTGTNSGTITIGNNSAPNLLRLAADNIDLSILGALTKITSLGVGDITMSGAFIQNNATGFTSGTGATSFRGSTIGIGDATTDRVTFTAQIQGGSPLVFQGTTDNTFSTTLAVTDPTSNNTITLPDYSGTVVVSSNAGTAGECLKSNGASTAPSYGTCGSASTLQDVYDASGTTSPQIALSAVNGGLKVRDSATPVTGNMLQFQNNAETATYFGVSTTATALQNSSGVKTVELLNSGELRIYDPANFNASNYASITYSGTTATFAASTGTTRVGNGSGNITLTLANVADVLAATKTATLSGAYSANDFSFTRNLTAGSNVLNGSVVNIESLSSGTNVATSILRINENNTASTGNLIVATTGGSGNDKFKVNTGGTVTIASGQSYTGVGAVTVSSGSGNLTLQAAGSSATVIRAATDSANAFNVQDSLGNVEFQIDTDTGQYAFGANGIVSGARLGVRTTGSLDVLRLLDSSSATVFSVGNTGNTLIKPSSSAAAAFQVQNTGSVNMLTANSTNSRVEIGTSTAGDAAILLVLDNNNGSTDPTGVAGAMYYNTTMGVFRCYEGTAWRNCNANKLRVAATVNSTSTSFADITGLTTYMNAGETYAFDCKLTATSAATTTAVYVSVNGPAATALDYFTTQHTSATAQAVAVNTTYDSVTGLSGSSFGATRVPLRIEGTVVPSASGNFSVRFRTEVAGSQVSIQRGSYCTIH